MRTALISLAFVLAAFLTIGCNKDEPAESQESTAPPTTSTASEEATGETDQPNTTMTDGDLSINPNAAK